jgi:hypothetical protein
MLLFCIVEGFSRGPREGYLNPASSPRERESERAYRRR